jgi:hypothetical protein
MEGPIEMAASGLNLRRDLADVLGVLAQEHLRSMNAEIVWALRQHLAAWEDGTEEKLR